MHFPKHVGCSVIAPRFGANGVERKWNGRRPGTKRAVIIIVTRHSELWLFFRTFNNNCVTSSNLKYVMFHKVRRGGKSRLGCGKKGGEGSEWRFFTAAVFRKLTSLLFRGKEVGSSVRAGGNKLKTGTRIGTNPGSF